MFLSTAVSLGRRSVLNSHNALAQTAASGSTASGALLSSSRRLGQFSANAPPASIIACLLPNSETVRRWRADAEPLAHSIRSSAAAAPLPDPTTESILQSYAAAAAATRSSSTSSGERQFFAAVHASDQDLERIVERLERPADLIKLLSARDSLVQLVVRGSCAAPEELQRLALRKVASLAVTADEAAQLLRLLRSFEYRQPPASLLRLLEEQAVAQLREKENGAVALDLFAAFAAYRHRFALRDDSVKLLVRQLKDASFAKERVFTLLEALVDWQPKKSDLLRLVERKAAPSVAHFSAADLVRYSQLVDRIHVAYNPKAKFLDAFHAQLHKHVEQLSLDDIEAVMNFYSQLYYWKPSVAQLRHIEKHVLRLAQQRASRETLPRTSLVFDQSLIKPAWVWGP